jgi:CRP/FNR family transcriptional regulator
MDPEQIKKVLPEFPDAVYNIISTKSKLLDLPPGQVLLKEGYFVNAIPFVLEGLLKVTRRDEDKEILLYYINKGESCIMSFSACISDSTSKIFAATEKDSQILLVSAETVKELIREYPTLNNYFHRLYQNRYENLLETIDKIVFHRFDERLYQYLQERSNALGTKELKTTHQEIAGDTGTVREVVSRTLKKLEKEGKIRLTRNEIKIL